MNKKTAEVGNYDLNRSQGNYKAVDSLQVWNRFDPSKDYPGGGRIIPGDQSRAGSTVTTLVQGFGSTPIPVKPHMSDATYLRGHKSAGSIITEPNTKLKTDLSSQLDLSSNSFTIMSWSRFDDEVISTESDAQIMQIETADHRWQVIYDKDGGGTPDWRPSINIVCTNTSDDVVRGSATYILDAISAPYKRWTGWNQVTFTAQAESGLVEAATHPDDWTVMFGDVTLLPTSTIFTSRPAATTFSQLTAGGPNAITLAKGRLTVYGEVAVWSEPLTINAVSAIYSAATTANSTGFSSLGPRAQICSTACEKDAYPTIARSTDQTRLNRSTPYFNDTETIVFGDAPGTPVNYAARLLSGSTDVSSVIATPNTPPNIYIGGATATGGQFQVTSNPDAEPTWFSPGLILTDALDRRVMFTGSSASGHEEKSKKSYSVYGIGYWSTFSGSAVTTPYEAAGRIVEAINFASQSGDLAISATLAAGGWVYLTQLHSGKSGNTQVEGPFITAGGVSSVGHFTGGTGTPGTGSIPSRVVGNYRSRAVKSHASPMQPFDDSKVRTNITAESSYLPNFAPGFTKNLSDRLIIEIDITPGEEHVLRIVSGADGQCYIVGNPGILPGDDTGLAYFNFKDKQWENVGATMPREGKAGWNIPWNLPQELSKSSGDLDPRRNGGTNYSLNNIGVMAFAPNQTDSTLEGMRNVNIHSAPRLFQPFSSLTAHRSTFNFIYDWGYMNRNGPGTGNKYTQEVLGLVQKLPALDNTSIWDSTYPATNDPDRTQLGTPNYPTNKFYAVHSRFQCDMVNVMTSDWLGLSKRLDIHDKDSKYDFRKPKYWNIEDGSTGSIFHKAVNDQLSAVGLPIAYTKFSTNPRFYASSSQLIKIGDYIDAPFLLEAMEIETDIDVRRMFYTTVVTQSGGRGTFDQTEVSAWSTTNNSVDCLTFFLAKQDDPTVAGPGLGDTLAKNAKASRELITWSNTVAYSPYIGWDFWQSWSHPYVSETALQPLGVGSGPDGKWPRSGLVGKEVHFAYYPACGRRIARYFKLDDATIKSNVEACDTATSYVTAGGSPPVLNQGGKTGIFPEANYLTEPLTGVPTGSDGVNSDRKRTVAQQQERWMTASLHVHNLFPVRVCGPYYQHDVPLLPADQFCKGGNGLAGVGNANRGNIYPHAQANSTTTLTTPSGPLTTPATFQAGWDWLGRFATYGVMMMTGPREYLSCYGRWWPGGTRTSAEYNTAKTNRWALPNATLQQTSSLDPSCKRVTLPTDQTVPASSPRVYALRDVSKIEDISLVGRPHRVSVEFGPTHNVSGDVMTEVRQTRPPDEAMKLDRPLGQGTTGFEPYFARFPTSGNVSYSSAYVLDPADNLIFGCQWSPADAVHRSFRNVERVLQYGGGIDGGGTPWYGVDCSYDPISPNATGWGITGQTYSGGGLPGTQILSPYAPLAGWTVPAGCPQDGGGPSTNAESTRKAMEYQYRFLGWDQSNDLTVHKEASCTIKATPQKIKLYGVLLKNQKQYHHQLSQQTKTVCVHEAISNGPVIDQYDLASNSDFAGSLAAMVFSGSMESQNETGGPGLLTKGYALLNYGYGVATGSCVRQVWGTSAGETGFHDSGREYSRYYDMGKINRTITTHDISEIYYDSMTPSIRGLWRKDGFQLLKYDPAGFPTETPFAAWAYTHVGDTAFTTGKRMAHTYWTINSGSTHQTNTSPNYKWPLAFPFEPRYHGVRRVLSEAPLKVAGVVDRNHSDRVVGQHSVSNPDGGIYERGQGMRVWATPTTDPGQFVALFPGAYPDDGLKGSPLSGSSGSFWQGFSWETGWGGSPIYSLGLIYNGDGRRTNAIGSTGWSHVDGFGTQWTGKRGGLQDEFTSGSGGRADNHANPGLNWQQGSGWSWLPWNLFGGGAAQLNTYPAQETWCTDNIKITDGGFTPAFGGDLPVIATTPRPGVACTIGGYDDEWTYRNLGYVYYPHYPRVLNPENLRKPLTTQRMTGPEFTPPLQYSYHSGGFGEICVKNTVFGVGRLMFAPEPTHVFISSSKDTVQNSSPQFHRAQTDAGYSYTKAGARFTAFGNSPHFDFFCGKPRGWRYGLLNGFPLRPICVWRRDRYGQFRDMLEQRQYSAFYINDPADIRRDRRRKGRRIRRNQYPRRDASYPVISRFRTPMWENPNATNVEVSPATTTCSNLNQYSTSSLPYFDEEVKNRDALPATSEVVII